MDNNRTDLTPACLYFLLLSLYGCSDTTQPFSAMPETQAAESDTTDSQTTGTETLTTDQTPTSGDTGTVNPEADSQSGTTTSQHSDDYCAAYLTQTDTYFCEDFTATSPVELVGSIPPMSFRDQTFRTYSRGEVFTLSDPDAATHVNGVLDLHTQNIEGNDFSVYAKTIQEVSRHWDITAHSRDGYVQPGTGSGFNDSYWWNENQFMGDHGARCGKPIDLALWKNSNREGERAFTFMEQFFSLPAVWSGNELELDNYWKPKFEAALTDDAGIHHIVRYEDMIYLCADHLMTAAYGSGASKLSLTPDHLLDTTSGRAVVEFSVSTYRTAGRDYWQLDLSPLETHLQLPEGDVVADANGKAFNGLAINTELGDSMTGPADIVGGINVFRTMMVKDNQFMNGDGYFKPDDPEAQFIRGQIANPGDASRLALYEQAPNGLDWVIKHSNYNQVMYDYLDGDNNPDITLHNVTSNRSRTRFRLTIVKEPTLAGWADTPALWDQISLCLPDYGGECIGEYIVPELPVELLVQFTHYAYNTTKSCSEGGEQPHQIGGPTAVFQSTCHANTYHWDNFYLSPTTPFQIIKAEKRTDRADATKNEIISLDFDEPSPPNSKLRFTALTSGSSNDTDGMTSLEVSFDDGTTWHRPERQAEPENSFDKFRSYYTGEGDEEFIPTGIQRVLFRADNAAYRDAYWIRDASFWSFQGD